MNAGRILLIVCCLAATVAAQTTEPATQPTSRPALTREQEVDQLLTYLNGQYGKLLKSQDWIERSLAVISLARLPGTKATDQLLAVVRFDPTPAVRIVAWQAILSRAKWLDVAQYQTWLDATDQMCKKDYFRGTTRVGLLQVMALNPPSRSAKLLFVSIFAQTNALEPQDIPVLDALGDCLASWKTPDLGTYLFNRLSNLNDAYRAEYVLHRAGLDTPWAGEHMDLGSGPMWKLAIDNNQQFLKQGRLDWRSVKPMEPKSWKTLEAQLIPSADLDAPINPNDPVWRHETELGRVDPKPLDVVFVVDATGSMQHVLDFLKRDIGHIRAALELVANHPRIGLTFYRDNGDMFVTRSMRLSENLNALDAFIGTIDAHGGVDRPEAVLDALTDALKANPWSWKGQGRREIVLLTDAPPHPETQADCLAIAKGCKENRVSLQIMKVKSLEDQDDLRALDDLAEAAGTEPMWMPLQERQPFRFPLPELVDRESLTGCRVAFAPPANPAGRQILKRLLVEAINPQFADRVEPLVDIILALTAPSSVEKRAPFGVPSPAEHGVDMGKPHDPQER